MYGGIVAEKPNFGSTDASDLVFAVYITKLGNDEIGRQILESLRRERAIDTSRVSISPVPPTPALSGNHSVANQPSGLLGGGGGGCRATRRSVTSSSTR